MANVSRRDVAKGAAWSIPAVTLTGAATAVAASGCTPTLRASLGTTFDYGTIFSTSGRTTTQTLNVGGQAYVDNLPQGVTVTKITYQFWFEKRSSGSTGSGAPWMGDATSDKRGTCASGACSTPWTPAAGSGFSPVVTSTTSGSSQTYPDGVARPSWDVNFAWNSSTAPGTYGAGAGGCRNFTTGPSGRLVVTYSGVAALSTSDEAAGKKVIATYVTVIATLSDGTVLRRVYQTSL